MSFLKDNFSSSGSQSRKGEAPQQYTYKSATDTKTQMLAANYFNEVAFQMNDDDSLTVIGTDGLGVFHVVSSDAVNGIVVVDDDLSQSLPETASFKNVFELSDFPEPVLNKIILENGVNYLVWIAGPVNSPLHFSFPSDYSLGGSLIYMGAPGLLEWNLEDSTSDTDAFIASQNNNGGSFLIRGFKVTDVDGLSEQFVLSEGQDHSNPFDKIVIESCQVIDFLAFLKTNHTFDIQIISSNFSQPATSGVDTIVIAQSFKKLFISKSDIETKANDHILLISPDGSAPFIDSVRVEDTIFRRSATTPLSPIKWDSTSFPNEVGIFDNCVGLRDGVITSPSFNINSEGAIESILNSGGSSIRIKTFKNHGLSTTDRVQIWAALEPTYNFLNLTVTRINDTEFDIGTAFVSNNYSGFFRRGGFDGYPAKNIIVKDSLGFYNSRSSGEAVVFESTTPQTMATLNTYQKFIFTAGEISGPKSAILRDIYLASYTNMQLRNASTKEMNLTVSVHYNILKDSDLRYNLKFRVDNDTDRESIPFEVARDVGTDQVGSFSTNLFVAPDEIIELYITQTSGVVLPVTFQSLRISATE